MSRQEKIPFNARAITHAGPSEFPVKARHRRGSPIDREFGIGSSPFEAKDRPLTTHLGSLNKPQVDGRMIAIGLDATPDPVIIASDETAPPLVSSDTSRNINFLNGSSFPYRALPLRMATSMITPDAAITSRRWRSHATSKKGHFLMLHPILVV